jgi:hypothetical protein
MAPDPSREINVYPPTRLPASRFNALKSLMAPMVLALRKLPLEQLAVVCRKYRRNCDYGVGSAMKIDDFRNQGKDVATICG